MANRPRKSSACITLVLIGAAALSGCGDTAQSSRRAAYATKEQCLADWGDPKDCEEQPRASSGSRFYGPSSSTWHSYSSGSHSGTSSSSHSISRGGFGSHGSSSS
jgi:uncharacterized protein YgiB involved in biofilm formation